MYIKNLFDLTENDRMHYGAKAVNLSLVKGLGFDVPPGFCINNGLHEKLKNDGIDELPGGFIEELKVNYDKLSAHSVAVRSSALGEDSSGVSYAGIYKTFLNVTTFEDVCQAVLDCINSTRAERAQKYSGKNSADGRETTMTVIVQSMVKSDVSGVAFTANPVTNNMKQVVINSAWGIGESVVGDEVQPDEWIADKDTKSIVFNKTADKKKMTAALNSGVKTMDVADELRKAPSLSGGQVRCIIDAALEIEDYFEKPQDIEWAYYDDTLYILQSRDITTLYPVGKHILQSKKHSLYMCYNSMVQGVSEPFTPMGFDFWHASFAGYTSIFYSFKKKIDYPKWITDINGRLYFDLTEVVSKKFYAKYIPDNLNDKDPAGGKLLRQIIQREGEKFYKQGGNFKLSLGLVKWGMSFLKYIKVGKRNPEAAVLEAVSMADEYIEKLNERISKTKSIKGKVKLTEDVMEELLTLAFSQVMYCSYGIKAAAKRDKWIEKRYPKRFDLESLRKAFASNPTTQMGLELNRIALYFKEAGAVPNAESEKVKEFLKTYGHRADIEVDMGTKRWREDSSYVLDIIASYMKDDTAKDNISRFEEQDRRALRTIDEIYAAVLKDKGKNKAGKIKSDYLNFRITAGLRERPKFDVLRVMELLRIMLLDAGSGLCNQGALDDDTDVCYLHLRDLADYENCDIKAIAAQNRALYEKRVKEDIIPPRFVLSTGECFYYPEAKDSSDGVYKGVPISKGLYEGRVKVVYSPHSADIQKGDIIVAHNTNPSWTPLFLNAGALVMESGGPIAHGAIVAREYGIPAVAGIAGAVSIFSDGDIILVDGQSGTVKLMER